MSQNIMSTIFSGVPCVFFKNLCSVACPCRTETESPRAQSSSAPSAAAFFETAAEADDVLASSSYTRGVLPGAPGRGHLVSRRSGRVSPRRCDSFRGPRARCPLTSPNRKSRPRPGRVSGRFVWNYQTAATRRTSAPQRVLRDAFPGCPRRARMPPGDVLACR